MKEQQHDAFPEKQALRQESVEPAAGNQSEAPNAAPRSSAGRPLKVLSTSLGAVLVANLMMVPLVQGETATDSSDQPKLVEWSSDQVKAYFDPNADWSIPVPGDAQKQNPPASPEPSESPAAGTAGDSAAGGTGGGSNVIVHQSSGFGGGFGWDDLLLYHMIFNRGGAYSSSGWVNQHPVYDARTDQPYQPRTYASGTFQNKPVAGSTVQMPKTSTKSGSFSSKSSLGSSSSSGSASAKSGSSSSSTSSTSSKSSSSSSFSSSSKSTSSSTGSIGGKSGGFSSSGGSSSGS